MKHLTKVFIWTFLVLYLGVGIVSTIHTINFFGIANDFLLACILGLTFELGQAITLYYLLQQKTSKRTTLTYVLTGVLTLVQCMGNVFTTYKYILVNKLEDVQYFMNSVLFGFIEEPETAIVLLAYIIGAILPIIALCMTAMVSDIIKENQQKKLGRPEGSPNKKEKAKQQKEIVYI